MIVRLLKFRLWQLYREAKLIGLVRMLFIGMLVLPLIASFFYKRISVPPFCYWLPVGVAVILLAIQLKRQDFTFLTHLTICPSWIYGIEYMLCTFFVPLFLFLNGLETIAAGYLAVIWVIAFIPPQRRKMGTYSWLVNRIPDALFEWKSGWRQNPGVLLLAFVLGVAGLFSFGVAMVAFFLFTVIFVSFYTEDEPLNVLLAGENKHFLTRKLILHLRSFALLLAPFLLLALVHVSFVVYTVAAYLSALNVLMFAILLKYSYYRPSGYKVSRSLLLMFVCLCSVILPLGILLFLSNLILYRKASENVKQYFYVVD